MARKTLTHMIIYGDTTDGFCCVGPFKSEEAAQEYMKHDDLYNAEQGDKGQVVRHYPPAKP